MAYRVDPDGKSWYDNGGVRQAASAAQQALFLAEIALAESLRAQAGGPAAINPDKEQLLVVEEGDTLWDIAEEHDVAFGDILAANANNVNDNGNLIDINDIIILPQKSPELVSQSDTDVAGIPAGEAAFIDEIYGRGNRLQYDDTATMADVEQGRSEIAADVGAYLDGLPADQRQAAVARMLGNAGDWQDSSAGLIGIQAAAKQRGLAFTPDTAFASQLYSQGNALEYNDAPGVNFAAEQGKITQFVKDRLNAMPEADRQQFLQKAYDQSWTDSGPAQIAIEQAAKELNIELRPSSHGGQEVEAAARSIIDTAIATGKPDAAFISLNEAFANAPSQLQNVLQQNPETQEIIAKAASWATANLANFDPKKATSDQGDALIVMTNLEVLTRPAVGTGPGTDKTSNLSDSLLAEALPTIKTASEKKRLDNGDDLIGWQGQQKLTTILGRLDTSEQSDAIVQQFINMDNGNAESMRLALSEGAAPDYPITVASQSGSAAFYVDKAIVPGVQAFASGTLNTSVDNYLEHESELQWLIANHGATMTAEQLEQAIADYKTEKGTQWQQEEKELEAAVIGNGQQLLTQLSQLSILPEQLAAEQGKVDKTITTILSDDKNIFAMQMALRESPDLLANPDTVNFLGQKARLTDRGRKLAEEAATLLVRNELLPSFANIDPKDAAGLAKAQEGLEQLRDGRLAKLLGISDAEFGKALDLIKQNMPAAGDTEQQMIAKLKQIDSGLNDPRNGFKSFKNTEVPGQILRMIGVAGTGVGLFATASQVSNDPLLHFKLVIDSAGLSQRTVELLHGFKALDAESFAVKHFGSSRAPCRASFSACLAQVLISFWPGVHSSKMIGKWVHCRQ